MPLSRGFRRARVQRQVTSRRKEVERIQTADLARSNIARPYIRFDMNAAFGAASAGNQGREKII